MVLDRSNSQIPLIFLAPTTDCIINVRRARIQFVINLAGSYGSKNGH